MKNTRLAQPAPCAAGDLRREVTTMRNNTWRNNTWR